MRLSLLFAAGATILLAEHADAQVEYRNLDGGRPVRVEDAAPTERHALDLDLTTRIDWLSLGRERLLIEPRMAYGILPNTEFSLRVPVFFRERAQSPRAGISGVGIGGMRELRLESRRLPALAVAGEAFLPVGLNRVRPGYSAKALATRAFPVGRLHLNAGYGSFTVRQRPSLVITGQCGQPGLPPCPIVPLGPPLDGPCAVSLGESVPTALFACNGSQGFPGATSKAAAPGRVVRLKYWLVGLAGDKTLPLRSIVFVGDVFVEHFEGLQRLYDWTAELGLRRQFSPRLVLDATVGRHYYGNALSTFVKFGTSFSSPVLVRRR
jgi:hypothetical protein